MAKHLLAADMPAAWHVLGKIEKGAGDTITTPQIALNVGGFGGGCRLDPVTDWDPTANTDGSFAAHAIGDDIYLYAVSNGDGTASLVASKNASVPSGYTASNSRRIGGYHYGRWRGIANRYDTAFTPAGQILPNSVWDLSHRPTCDPTGMVEVIEDTLWVDIYLNSAGSGSWPEIVPVSRHNATPLKDDVYARIDFHQVIGNSGKRLPTVAEFLRYAEGAPAGEDGSNDQAWANTGNSGPTTTGGVAKAVSQYNVVDAVGNLWDWLDCHFDRDTANSWDQTVVDVGQDSTIDRGYVNHSSWRAAVGGGYFGEGVHAGARCLYLTAGPWHANGNVGLRGVCDAL